MKRFCYDKPNNIKPLFSIKNKTWEKVLKNIYIHQLIS